MFINEAIVSLLVVAIGIVVWSRRRRHRPVTAGQCALVTGASSGIGAQLAQQLAARGCHLYLVARRMDRLQDVAEKCRRAGAASATIIQADLCDDVDRQRLTAAVMDKIDVLVLNAGIGGIAPFSSQPHSITTARALMETNYFANVDICRRLLDSIVQRNSRVLVMSSISGLIATPQRTQYCASKFALQGFINSLRQELRPFGVQITTVCPGVVQTEFHEKVITAGGAAPQRKGHFMPQETCAMLALGALESSASELVLPLTNRLGYWLRAFMPETIDGLAGRVAASTVAKPRQ